MEGGKDMDDTNKTLTIILSIPNEILSTWGIDKIKEFILSQANEAIDGALKNIKRCKRCSEL